MKKHVVVELQVESIDDLTEIQSPHFGPGFDV